MHFITVLYIISALYRVGSSTAESNKDLAKLANQTAYNVSKLLDNLLKDYDNNLRPDFGGPSTLIDVNMQVRSMGPISEMDMSYIMDCYFRQSWVDKRLAFTGYKDALALSIEMLRKIWKPDTFMYNGKKSYLHTITTPNRFVRLFPNGRVLYSQRLTIRATCIMNLEGFPMDKQKCPLRIGSFGYTADDVTYKWTTGRGVNIASDMKLSQFDLISTPTGTETTLRNQGIHSTLIVSFHLQRHMGDFVIQVYGPCILLVVISWVSFWLNREATSDRISLGITTVLTMTFLGLEARKDLPKVPYPTALDYFVFISFTYIFSTVVQFGIVHHFTKVGSGEYYLEELEDEPCPQVEKRKRVREIYATQQQILDLLLDSCTSLPTHNGKSCGSNGPSSFKMQDKESSSATLSSLDFNFLNHHPTARNFKKSFQTDSAGCTGGGSLDTLHDIPDNIPGPARAQGAQQLQVRELGLTRDIFLLENEINERETPEQCVCKRCVTRAFNDSDKCLNSVSKIDRISRIVFPSTYLGI
ncbi:gamma-aminobutyric acid receptor alpha-like [Eurytemora carolleeae]|uniref:gamma-aminobutyric acid receptor alpha-like n=1 Tax=Eurytemora carolleeae TaxID=1294199 RepID=UPI000C76734B|nr:gamma-aminobutyric acid receptor alpha-like [Eurytemora carolleeae]|eukprot:XP_023346187.1 gamma-aminobutyric acid receptor alpha-like [Eurytemora affinis]